jgi:hypothetical protein
MAKQWGNPEIKRFFRYFTRKKQVNILACRFGMFFALNNYYDDKGWSELSLDARRK